MEDPVFEPSQAIARARGTPGFDAPKTQGLWRTGTLEGLGRPCVAVVGTRAATPFGRRLAHAFSVELGRSGCTIVSGLALGIDSAAHEGALAAGARTIGVLGGGHRCFFPRRNRALAQRMVDAGGAVISPYPPDAPAHPPQFLHRNGIVAALADAVLVIEAPARSGALNTAGWAAGRIPVLAVPGDVDRPHVAGCLALIRDGATLARHAGDVLEALGRQCEPAPVAVESETDPLARSLLDALGSGECALDELVERSGATAPAVLATLTLLELRGRVARVGSSRFACVGASVML